MHMAVLGHPSRVPSPAYSPVPSSQQQGVPGRLCSMLGAVGKWLASS